LDIEEEKRFIASHFYEFEVCDLRSLSSDILDDLLSDSDLRLRDEDLLLSLICELGEDYRELLCHVEFVFLSVRGVASILSVVSEDSLDSRLWSSICRRLIRPIDSSLVDTSDRFVARVKDERVGFVEGSAFTGIISRFRSECGGNPHEKGIISITASTTQRNKCWKVVDYGWNGYWYSTHVANSWIQFDFKTNCVELDHYSLKSDGHNYHLLQWILEGSLDGQRWTILDTRNTQDLNGTFIVKTYECNSRSSEFFRYIRLRQTGKNSNNADYLMLSEIEFFGLIRRPLT
jgi:hypothetical protein